MKLNLFRSKLKSKVETLSENLKTIEEQVKEASHFVNEIEKGNFQEEISDSLSTSELGRSLVAMKTHLDKIASEEQIRGWLNTGLSNFSDILRNKNSLNLKELSDAILFNLVKYVSANQGVIFILEQDENGKQFLKSISCYAYNRNKHVDKRIEIGEGLAGQCVLEKQSNYLEEIPSDYVTITSGLGEATPKSIYISPLLINDSVFGVIELASLSRFKPQHLEFIDKLSENVAVSIKSVKDSERTLFLLNESQQQAEELKTTEEELRQNMEEMQATQEEMKRRSDELKSTSAEMKGVMDGINATMATIEFEPDGTIITANANFLKTMNYSLNEIKGQHHKLFVPKEILESNDYQTFWKRLSAGESFTGVFQRLSSSGHTVWLNAIYNPILNANGEVSKVVKFATDITKQQEMLAENKGVVSGINATMATIEFEPNGTIITANANFLKTMNYSLNEIKGQHHKLFVPKEILESNDYQTFWKRLSEGESFTGVFQRLSSSGHTVWLNAIYNPILNANGEVSKVVKFATDITTEKEKEAEIMQMLEETKSQEEELRQNMEEMRATQEEMGRRNHELKSIAAEMKGVMDGINATMATIEFEPNGTIITANANFLKTMNYSLNEIKGQHHKLFVPKEILESNDYQTFWKRLSEGESFTSVFQRLSSSGHTVWLNAIYNPILNANGEVSKVVKFATDITKQQEMLAENKGVVSGINATMATIEFEPDGTIITANANFLKTMNYSLNEIKGQHHKLFVPKEILESNDYQTFWKRLSAGESFTGIFQRLSSSGHTIWLNAIYNPILNANGEVSKVVKFATDITDQRK